MPRPSYWTEQKKFARIGRRVKALEREGHESFPQFKERNQETIPNGGDHANATESPANLTASQDKNEKEVHKQAVSIFRICMFGRGSNGQLAMKYDSSGAESRSLKRLLVAVLILVMGAWLMVNHDRRGVSLWFNFCELFLLGMTTLILTVIAWVIYA